MKSYQANITNIKVGNLVYHKFLSDNSGPRFATVIEEDDGYGDVGVVFQEHPNLTYYFEIENLMIIEE